MWFGDGYAAAASNGSFRSAVVAGMALVMLLLLSNALVVSRSVLLPGAATAVVVVGAVGLMFMSRSSGFMLRLSVTVLMDCKGSPPVTPTPSRRTRMLRNVRRYFSASLVDKGWGPVGGVVVVGVPVTGSTVIGRVVLISWGRLSSVEAIWRTLWVFFFFFFFQSVSILPLKDRAAGDVRNWPRWAQYGFLARSSADIEDP